MHQWLYTTYINFVTSYLGYLAQITVLLVTTNILALTIYGDNEKLFVLRNIPFLFAIIFSLISLIFVFQSYDEFREMMVAMFHKCKADGLDIKCGVAIQENMSTVKKSICSLIISFLFLVMGYCKNQKHMTFKTVILVILSLIMLFFSDRIFSDGRSINKTNGSFESYFGKNGNTYYILSKKMKSGGYEFRWDSNRIKLVGPAKASFNFIGPNSNEKLNINISHTLKNAKIYINDYFSENTDSKGAASLDASCKRGVNILKLIGSHKEEIHYYFEVLQDTQMTCAGSKNNFRCESSPL